MNRAAATEAFLASAGWENALRHKLAGDASARSYERLVQGGASCLLMDVPPASGLATEPYIGIAEWLLSEGFSAPRILAAMPENGLVLIEDLGDDLFAHMCKQDPSCETELYEAAIDTLVALQKCHPPKTEAWAPPPYNMAVLMREAGLLIEWYLPLARGKNLSQVLAEEYRQLVQQVFTGIPSSVQVAVMRDYHAENLIWLPHRSGRRRVGLLDFQDMLIGHPAYDLVSLLDDARRDVAPELRRDLLSRYLRQSPWDADEFLQAAHVLTVQRNLKILGLFTRLCRRDGKPQYINFLPRVWNHLQRNLRHPALASLAGWIDLHVPCPDCDIRMALREAAA